MLSLSLPQEARMLAHPVPCADSAISLQLEATHTSIPGTSSETPPRGALRHPREELDPCSGKCWECVTRHSWVVGRRMHNTIIALSYACIVFGFFVVSSETWFIGFYSIL